MNQQAPAIIPSTINRRLVAIAFADVAGFSRLMALNDAETVRRWKALRTEIMQPHMVRHGGRVAEIAGDEGSREWKSRPATGRGKLKAAWLADAVAKLDQKNLAKKSTPKKKQKKQTQRKLRNTG